MIGPGAWAQHCEHDYGAYTYCMGPENSDSYRLLEAAVIFSDDFRQQRRAAALTHTHRFCFFCFFSAGLFFACWRCFRGQ
ncbi:Hypothetical predicted protein [Xyrichtys novacula]|uniref:Uncharacterized protein n=1 Tax=Xyrichtys novacula TaxID=13765 RepID=A0AAV1HGF8_XYRNO|nr:Hypothetical predicted protein [Xyrichtys novacula]